MKRLLLISTVAATIAACGEKKEEPKVNPNVATVSGKITNPVEDKVFFKIDEKVDTAYLDSTGAFSIEINVPNLTEARLVHGPEYGTIYLHNGFDVNMTLNTEEFDESIKFSGKGAGLSNYSAGVLLMEELSDMDAQKRVFSLPLEAFNKTVDSLKQVQLDNLNKGTADVDANNPVVINLQKEIEFDWYYRRYEYPSFHNMFAEDSVHVDSTYYNFMSDINLNDESLVDNQNYMVFLWTVANRESMSWESPEENLKGAGMYSYIKNNFEGKVRSSLLSRFVGSVLRYDPLGETTGAILEDYQTVTEDKEDAAQLLKEYNSWKSLKPGNPAPNFTFEDINGNQVSLSDFKGKLVYIDVWATWCGPCKYEIPFFKQLVNDYEGNDKITFMQVSVDTDRDKETWRKMVEEEKINATQLFANGWHETIAGAYNINGIPRFMLIGKDGEIINAKAPRPSAAAEIKALIDENL